MQTPTIATPHTAANVVTDLAITNAMERPKSLRRASSLSSKNNSSPERHSRVPLTDQDASRLARVPETNPFETPNLSPGVSQFGLTYSAAPGRATPPLPTPRPPTLREGGLSPPTPPRLARPRIGGEAIAMANLRPEIIRALSGSTIPEPTPGIGLDPARTDFFVQASRNAHSLRPLVRLVATVAGRVVLMASLGGISTGFVKTPPLAPGLVPNGMPAGQDTDVNSNAKSGVDARVLAASSGGIAAGAAMIIWGLGSFAQDTWQLNPRRAAFMGALSVFGVLGVSGGGLTYIYGEDVNNYVLRWAACAPRTIGNFCVFYALPNAFATSEIVHGNAPIPNREQTRQLMFAVGGAMMMFWAHISSPGLNAPLWAREMAQAAALVGLCVGASLSRTNTIRLEAEGRATMRRRASDAGRMPA